MDPVKNIVLLTMVALEQRNMKIKTSDISHDKGFLSFCIYLFHIRKI